MYVWSGGGNTEWTCSVKIKNIIHHDTVAGSINKSTAREKASEKVFFSVLSLIF